MLTQLSVENLAVIERADLCFEYGMTVFTGETGAGKSLLVDAIQLVLGGRADSDLVRAGAAKACISATFDLSLHPELVAKLGLPTTRVTIEREVTSEGKSSAKINGKAATVGQLRAFGGQIVDLHGQHDHQALLSAEHHLGFLDAWIGEDLTLPLENAQDAFCRWQHLKAQLHALRTNVRDREHKLDLLRFQVQEISEADPKPGEYAALEAQVLRLANAEKLQISLSAAQEALSQKECSAQETISVAINALARIVEFQPEIASALQNLNEASFLIEDAISTIGRCESGLASPDTIDGVLDRVEVLKKLRRKYGQNEDEVLAFLQCASEELSLLEDAEAGEEETLLKLNAAEKDLDSACAILSALRMDRATKFGEGAQSQLRELGMEKALFEVRVSPKAPTETGADEVAFYFSANPGEPPRLLNKIASGGEISRVMLAIKATSAGQAGVPTLIFDEVDSGLSGRTAAIVARKLQELSLHYQVICISHLPQIAARAKSHFRIEKVERSGRTITTVEALDHNNRTSEIARMLANEEISESALQNARELLDQSYASVRIDIPA